VSNKQFLEEFSPDCHEWRMLAHKQHVDCIFQVVLAETTKAPFPQHFRLTYIFRPIASTPWRARDLREQCGSMQAGACYFEPASTTGMPSLCASIFCPPSPRDRAASHGFTNTRLLSTCAFGTESLPWAVRHSLVPVPCRHTRV
jgi:hypothetical protein